MKLRIENQDRIIKTTSSFLEKIKQVDETLTRLIKIKRRFKLLKSGTKKGTLQAALQKYKNEKIIYKQLLVNKLDTLDEMGEILRKMQIT